MNELQPTLNFTDKPYPFGGKEGFSAALDGKRLVGQLKRMFEILSDGNWHTLAEIHKFAGGSEAGCSARIRDLKKSWAGSHKIEKRRINGGLWEYRLGEK